MTGDLPAPLNRPPESPVRLSDLLALGEWLRDDARQVKVDLEERAVAWRQEMRDGHTELKVLIADVAGDVAELDRKSEGWQTVHAQVHISDDDDRRQMRDRLDEFLQSQALAKAKRDGLLGGVRYVANLIGANWRGIIALAGLIGILLGNIHIAFISPPD